MLHFAHANGYPPEAYQPLMQILARDYEIIAMRDRSLWPGSDPNRLRDWEQFTDDQASFMEEHKLDGIIGAGHSLGGTTTLRLALQQPGKYRAVVLLDPVLFPPAFTPIWKLIFDYGLAYQLHPLARTTLKRRRSYPSRQAIFERYRSKTVFSRMDDRGLWAYIQAVSQESPDGQVHLVVSPEWEARIYVTAAICDRQLWQTLASLQPPLLVLRGEHSDTFSARTARLIKSQLPQAVVKDIPSSGHLLPLERPEEVGRLIFQFLQDQFS
jgi:pimeloyl-ACP methyl ester carboxylesterase